jgi:ABC-type transporter Mla maintaining outer membrane lipid asymmetry ATPase subunit MlaF
MKGIVTLESVRVVLGEYQALREVSIGFEEGKSTVIMGPSGCGKSTLLKTAAGLIPPDAGKVLYRGQEMFQLSDKALLAIRRENSFVFQDGALWENLSLAENLALPLRVHHPEMPAAERNRKVIRALERVGLEDSATDRPASLSGGERKIASFLRALITEPALVFLDEPTLSIDHVMMDKINQMIRDMKSRGCTVIAVTHDAELTSTLADRLVIMDAGAVLESGSFDEVKRTKNTHARSILAKVLGEISSYDTDLLQLLDGEGDSN